MVILVVPLISNQAIINLKIILILDYYSKNVS